MSPVSAKYETQDAGLPSHLLHLVDLCLLAILFVAPLVLGGRHPTGCLVFVSVVAVMSVAWFSRQCLLREPLWRPSAAHWLFIGGILLLLFQIFPLPADFIAQLSPNTQSLLPLWSVADGTEANLGSWNTISMYPGMTIQRLALLVAYGLTFVVVVQRVQSLADVKKLLTWIALATVGMAILGLAQYLTTNGKILWTYEHPERKAIYVQGPFSNRNHFVHLLALGMGPLIWCFVNRMKIYGGKPRHPREKNVFGLRNKSFESPLFTVIIGIAVGIVGFTAILATSRGGALALAAALATIGIIYGWAKILDRRHAMSLLVFALIGITVFAIHGAEQIGERWDKVQEMSLDSIESGRLRMELWEANWNAFTQSPWFGHGVGAHREYYKMFLPDIYTVEFSHAENGYLQIASETGLAGLSFLCIAVGLCLFWCVVALRRQKRLTEVACVGAVAAALMASAVHSLVDFVWSIPACMSWTVVLCALACRLYQLSGDSKREPSRYPVPRVAWLFATSVIAVVGIWMVSIFWDPAVASAHWDRYQKYATERTAIEQEKKLFSNDPQKQLELQRVSDVLDNNLEQALRAYSMKHIGNARVNLRLAAIYLQQFQIQQRSSKNPMDVGQIRDAAIASEFPSRSALNEWLDRAIGDHRNLLDRALWHAHQSVAQCPLQGEGYLFLAELCFLEGGTDLNKSRYVEQALLVRPHDGSVLLMAGKEAAVAGDVAGAIAYWKQSFQCGIENKKAILYLLSSRIPAEALIEILEPQLKDWPLFVYQYTQLGNTAQLKIVCDYFYAFAQKQADSMDLCDTWYTLSTAYSRVEEIEKAASCAMRALGCNSGRFDVRMQLATLLIQLEQFADAEAHLRWCVSRNPDSHKARTLLAKAVKQRIARSNRDAEVSLPRKKFN